MWNKDRKGLIIVLSGPSGSGKTTVVQQLCEAEPAIRLSVSATTRPPREAEVNGQDYYFLSQEVFEAYVEAGRFVEHAAYGGHQYGTLKSELESALERQTDVLLEIDVQGAAQVLRYYPECVSVWIMPPSWDTLEKRLRERRTESEEMIRSRLQRAREEFESLKLYRYAVPNEDGKLAETVDMIRCILVAERCRFHQGSLQDSRENAGGSSNA